MENNPRTLISGRAGTGKTVVAIDRAIRLARGNTASWYICFQSALAKHIASGLRGNPDAHQRAGAPPARPLPRHHCESGITDRLQNTSADGVELFGQIFPAGVHRSRLQSGAPSPRMF